MRLDRPRTETSNPSAFSEFRSGLPISKVRLPAWLPKKYISSRAGLRAARAMLTATTRLSLAAWGRNSAPIEVEYSVNSRSGSVPPGR